MPWGESLGVQEIIDPTTAKIATATIAEPTVRAPRSVLAALRTAEGHAIPRERIEAR
jgi:hypothetical protein